MLLTKKKSLCVEEESIKREVTDADGECVLRINLKYPKLVCSKKDPLFIFARGFYKSLAEAFLKYAEAELAKRAREAKVSAVADFLPYSALMKYEITQCDERFLSVSTDISVSDGVSAPSVERKTQVWERQFGTKCKAEYFIPKKVLMGILKEKLNKEELKRLDCELFCLRDGEMEFYLRENGGYRKETVSILSKK